MLLMRHFIFEAVPKDLSSAGCGLLSRARISMSVQRRWPVYRRNERSQRGRSTDALARMAVTARLATALPARKDAGLDPSLWIAQSFLKPADLTLASVPVLPT